jgi:hypothetical protein
MEEPPGGHAAADVDQVTRFTAETIAARQARAGAWILVALGVGCILFGGVFFAAKHSGHKVVATVTHEGPCSNGTCTVNVVYNAAGSQVTAVMYGVIRSEIYGPPSHRLLNITYDAGYESDPTTNDMPNAIWIGFGAAGLAFVGWGTWWRLRRKRPQRELTVAAPGGAESPANPGLYPDPGGEPGLRRWDGRQWSPFLLRADPASGKPAGGKAPAEVWAPLAGSQPQWHDTADRIRRAGIVFAAWVGVTAVAAAVTMVLYARDLSKPQADFTLAVFALLAAVFALGMTFSAWARRKNLKKIDLAGKAAAASAGAHTAAGPGDAGRGPQMTVGDTGAPASAAGTPLPSEVTSGFPPARGRHRR